MQSLEKKGGLNGDTYLDTVPQCLCAEALPKFLDELVTSRKKFPEQRILMSMFVESKPGCSDRLAV